MFQNIIIKVSFILLIVANGLAVLWFIYERCFEPAITSILILAAILGIFVERWITHKERRKELLYALAHELHLNIQILQDKAYFPNSEERKIPVVFPRLESSILDSAISSGVFIDNKDKKLFNFLHSWRRVVNQFNHQLMATEVSIFTNPSPKSVETWRMKLSRGIYLKQVRDI